MSDKTADDALKMLEDFIQAGEYVGSHFEFREIHRAIRLLKKENKELQDKLDKAEREKKAMQAAGAILREAMVEIAGGVKK